ncbi:MAG: hypothetical protein ABI175_22810 [Polyangiales bacterium]
MRVLVAVALIASLPRPALADDEAPTISPARRAAAIALAVVPGIVVHGIGSRVVKERALARRIVTMQAVGMAAMIVGGLPTGISGGNPYTIPGVPLLTTGTGLFLSSWLTDIWVAAGGPCSRPEPRATAPWAIELGSVYLRDAYRHRLFARAAGRIELGRVSVLADGLQHAGGDAYEAALGAEVRILGAPASGRYVLDTTRLAVRVRGRHRHDDDDMVGVSTGEAEVVVRFDHRRIADQLAGTFTDASAGIGAERASYTPGGHETNSLLLATFAWGMYLRDLGELRLFYDHRRDSLAGGLQAGRAAGFIGSFGVAVDLRAWGPWAARAELEYGSGWVGTLALRFQGGPR